METKSIAVVCSNQTISVTSAITQIAANAKFDVTLICDDHASCKETIQEIEYGLNEKADKGELQTDQLEATKNRIRSTTDLAEAQNSEVVIETVFEDRDLKIKTIKELDRICPPSTVLATNTSTVTVTGLANATTRPERVVGVHFIYFSPILKVVEIACGMHTSDTAFTAVDSLAGTLDLEVVYAEDVPGLLSTRIWMVHLNEAANNVYNKLVEPQALKKLNRTISPNTFSILESADFIGLDNCVALLQNLYYAYGDSKYVPSPLLNRMVDAGQIGIRSGRGFFSYT